MKQPLKILTNLLRCTIHGHQTIDFEISYDITGKIYHSKALVLDLPESAQRLIFGARKKSILKKINALEKLIPLIVPLSIVRNHSFCKVEIENIRTSIFEEIRILGISRDKLYELAAKESLEYYILSHQINPSNLPADTEAVWEIVISSIYHLGFKDTRLANLLRDYPHFYFKIFPVIVPFFKYAGEQFNAYLELGSCQCFEAKNILLKALDIHTDGEVLEGIFWGLAKQNIKYDKKLQDKLISLYHSEIFLNGKAKRALMTVMKMLPNKKKTHILGMEIVAKNDGYTTSIPVALKLLGMGFPAKKIAKVIVPKLSGPNPDERINAFRLLEELSQLHKYLPKNEQLLLFYLDLAKKDWYSEKLADLIANIFKRRSDKTIYKQIVSYLYTEDLKILNSTLNLISLLLYRPEVESAPFTTPQSKSKYLELLNQSIVNEVDLDLLNIISRIGKKEKRAEYIPLLYGCIEKNRRHTTHIMHSINHVLSSVEYNPIITDTYLETLQSRNYANRAAAIGGLKYANDIYIKELISKLEINDSMEKMHLAAKEIISKRDAQNKK